VLAAVASHSDRRFRWQSTLLAAVAIGLAAVGVGLALRPANAPSIATQVFAALDVRTTSEPIPTGGTATVVYSHEKNVGVLVMNSVQPPAPGTVCGSGMIRPRRSPVCGMLVDTKPDSSLGDLCRR
jgi:hypothetical protein